MTDPATTYQGAEGRPGICRHCGEALRLHIPGGGIGGRPRCRDEKPAAGSNLLARLKDRGAAGVAFADLYAEVNAAFDRIEDEIKLAGAFKLFSIKLHGVRQLTPAGYRFVIESAGEGLSWIVGYRPLKGRRSPVLVHAEKLDAAVDLLFQAWQGWAKDERKRRGEGGDDAGSGR